MLGWGRGGVWKAEAICYIWAACTNIVDSTARDNLNSATCPFVLSVSKEQSGQRSQSLPMTDCEGGSRMSFWVYILLCRDASYYVGHTDDLETRFADHVAGGISVYTRKRRPVKLVYSEEFATRIDALERECQLKGWSRAKKEALIKGNWERLKRLSCTAFPV